MGCCSRLWFSCLPPLLTRLTCAVCLPPARPTAREARISAWTIGVLQNPSCACLGKGTSKNREAQEHCWTPLSLSSSQNKESFAPANYKQRHSLSDSADSGFFFQIGQGSYLEVKACYCCPVLWPFTGTDALYVTAIGYTLQHKTRREKKEGKKRWL